MSGASFNSIWDPVVIYGWNCSQGGGRINSSFGALCEQWEGDYNLSGAGTDTVEHHIYFVNLSNGYTRPMSSQFNYDTGVDNFWTYSLNNGMSWKCLTSACALGNTTAAYFGFSPTAFEATAPATFGSNLTIGANGTTNGVFAIQSGNNTIGGATPTNNFQIINTGVSGFCPNFTSYTLIATGIDLYFCQAGSAGATFQQLGTTAVQHTGLNYDPSNLPLNILSVFRGTAGGSQGGLAIAPNWTADNNFAGFIFTTNGGGPGEYAIAFNDGSGGTTALTNLYTGGWAGIEADYYGDATKAFALTSSGVTMSTLGSSSTDLCITSGGVIATCSSLRKYKDNIAALDPVASLAEVMKLQPREFVWKSTGHKEVGFIVDEVQPIDDRLVTYGQDAPVGEVRDPKDPSKVVSAAQNQEVIANGVAYRQMTALLVAAFQGYRGKVKAALGSESAQIKALAAMYAAQQTQIDQLKARVQALTAAH